MSRSFSTCSRRSFFILGMISLRSPKSYVGNKNYRIPFFLYQCQNVHLCKERLLFLKNAILMIASPIAGRIYTRYPSNNYTYEGHLQFPSLSSCPWYGQRWRRRCPWPGQPGRSGPCPWAGSLPYPPAGSRPLLEKSTTRVSFIKFKKKKGGGGNERCLFSFHDNVW